VPFWQHATVATIVHPQLQVQALPFDGDADMKGKPVSGSGRLFLYPVGKEYIMDKAPASLLGEMSIMDRSGHKQLKWHTDKLDEIAVTKETFNYLIRTGYSAFASEKKAEAKHLVREFDPTMEEMVLVPRNVGG
jgi:hypothetical protein